MKGILFKPDMIQAIIEGRKTQTRRVIKPQPKADLIKHANSSYWISGLTDDTYERVHIPRYQVGETVYIKEAWCESYYGEPICYKLDGKESPGPKGFWRSPIFLKAINARYFILIKGVRAERLQEITPKDCIAEGIIEEYGDGLALRDKFENLWDSINKDYPWESNPWVFRYEFEYQAKEK